MNFKTYVIHYTPLTDRKINISNFLNKNNIDHIFYTKYDREELNETNIPLFYDGNREQFEHKIESAYKPPAWDKKETWYRQLSKAEISCSIKHIEVLKTIANDDSEYALILEDDAIPYKDNFVEDITNIIDSTPQDWDAIFIGAGCGMDYINSRIQNFDKCNDFVYKAKHPASNTTVSFLIKKSAAQKILNDLTPFQLVIDWELAYHFYNHNMNIYWAVPPVFYQGSKEGTYVGTISRV